MILCNFIAFMFHDPIPNQIQAVGDEQQLDVHKVLEMLQEYDIGNYIVAQEDDPYRHYHVAVEMATNDYNSFVSKTLRKRLNLRGRVKDGLPKQYGKVKGIRKPAKMIAYTLKQGVYISSIPESELQEYKSMSYVKDTASDDREIRDKLREYIDNTHYKDHFRKVTEEQLKKSIIFFLLKEKIRIRTSSQIDGYYKYLRQFSNHDYIKWDNELDFYEYLYL